MNTGVMFILIFITPWYLTDPDANCKMQPLLLSLKIKVYWLNSDKMLSYYIKMHHNFKNVNIWTKVNIRIFEMQ